MPAMRPSVRLSRMRLPVLADLACNLGGAFRHDGAVLASLPRRVLDDLPALLRWDALPAPLGLQRERDELPRGHPRHVPTTNERAVGFRGAAPRRSRRGYQPGPSGTAIQHHASSSVCSRARPSTPRTGDWECRGCPPPGRRDPPNGFRVGFCDLAGSDRGPAPSWSRADTTKDGGNCSRSETDHAVWASMSPPVATGGDAKRSSAPVEVEPVGVTPNDDETACRSSMAGLSRRQPSWPLRSFAAEGREGR